MGMAGKLRVTRNGARQTSMEQWPRHGCKMKTVFDVKFFLCNPNASRQKTYDPSTPDLRSYTIAKKAFHYTNKTKLQPQLTALMFLQAQSSGPRWSGHNDQRRYNDLFRKVLHVTLAFKLHRI